MNIKIERGCTGESITIKGAGTATANGKYCKVSSTKYVAANKNGNYIEYTNIGGFPISFSWLLYDISTIEEGNPYGSAYRNSVVDPANLLFSSSWTVDLGLVNAPTSQYNTIGNNLIIQKNGSGKTNQRKYIDLLPPNFINKVELSLGWNGYANGTYTRSAGGTTTFNGPGSNYIEWLGNEWGLFHPEAQGWPEDPGYRSSDLINWTPDTSISPNPVGVTENSLTFLFDPIFYKSEIQDGNQGIYPNISENDPVYLEELRNYQINNIIPTLNFNPLTWQVIPGANQGTKKATIKNNMLSYLKDPNNNDVEDKNFRLSYGSISRAGGFGINTPIDNKKSFLRLQKNNNSTLYTSNNSTLNFFIRLQRPVSHKNPNSGYIVREKRGTFLTSYANQHEHISFGYRSPYYNINGDNTYRLKFEPFSFVFSFSAKYSHIFNRPINYTVMTDYKYKFGEVYLISIVITNGNISIYINGEQQSIALLPFNPLINRTKKSGGASYYADRINQSPLAPNFLKKDGSTYPYIATSFSDCPEINYNHLIFGKSKMIGVASNNYSYSTILKRKRFLNNLDIGVINSYNIALSQDQILQIYNNFRYRYI